MKAMNEKAIELDQSKLLSLYGSDLVQAMPEKDDVKPLSLKVGKDGGGTSPL